MTIKVKIKNKKSEPKVSYPRLGLGDSSGNIYIQKEPSEDWKCIVPNRTFNVGDIATEVTPFERGQSVTLTQE